MPVRVSKVLSLDPAGMPAGRTYYLCRAQGRGRLVRQIAGISVLGCDSLECCHGHCCWHGEQSRLQPQTCRARGRQTGSHSTTSQQVQLRALCCCSVKSTCFDKPAQHTCPAHAGWALCLTQSQAEVVSITNSVMQQASSAHDLNTLLPSLHAKVLHGRGPICVHVQHSSSAAAAWQSPYQETGVSPV